MPSMHGIDRATGRAIALIVLLVLAAAALRGYVPAAEHTQRRQAAESPAALLVVIVLLGSSLIVIAVSIIARLRNRRAAASEIRALPTGLSGDNGRSSWRVVLVGLAVISAWLVITWLLTRLVGQHGFVVHTPGTHTNVPATGTAPPSTDTATPLERPQPNSGGDMFGYLAATAFGMLLLTAAAAVIAARTRRSGPTPASLPDKPLVAGAAVAGPESLARAAELGLAQVGDLSREPREAIIGCYAAMERELAHLPDAVPQDYDTPTEVLARAVDHHALTADNARQLVNLFAEARFSSHLMTEQHRGDAVRILALVLAEMRSPA